MHVTRHATWMRRLPAATRAIATTSPTQSGGVHRGGVHHAAAVDRHLEQFLRCRWHHVHLPWPLWTLFTHGLEQKPIVERWEVEYDIRPRCETLFIALDEKNAQCGAHQAHLGEAACTHVNTVHYTRTRFATVWHHAVLNYQRVVDELHCLELGRWKECAG